MPRNIDLTEAEWTLMEQLWGAPGQTGRVLTDALHKQTAGAQHHAYAPAPPDGKGRRPHGGPGRACTSTSPPSRVRTPPRGRRCDLLGRVYHGSLSLLVSAMTREETLSKAEIDELYAILDEMEAKQGDA